MMRLKTYKCFIVMSLIIALRAVGGLTAYADDFPMPNPEIMESEDGNRVFVFNPLEDDRYPAMGVYKNTEPLELIYLVNIEHMAFLINFYFSSDMQYFVFIPEASQSVALEFYKNGELIQTYGISSLVKNMDAVGYSISMAFWEDRNRRNFDSADNTLTITTVDNLTYVFDITTGEAIKGNIIRNHTTIIDGTVVTEPIPFVEQGAGTIILEGPDGEVSVDVIIGGIEEPEGINESQHDIFLIIGISLVSLCAGGLIVGFVIYWRIKKRNAFLKRNTSQDD